MSENMKKIYQAYADSIAPAPDMQERLKRQLYAEMQGERPRKRKLWKRAILPVVGCSLCAVPCEWWLPDLCGNGHLQADREGRRPLDHRS